ncbi:MAG: thioredoxin family protein [Burkholderiaceae bacterium]|jgi:thioredoxin-like negative regulator of GroEL|nr:MAG: thioredoxin family protein [Burkholderiaceae bacterium]
MPDVNSPPDSTPRRVVCLCAAWCDTCRDYRATFDAAAAARPQWQFRWVDIEDEADLVGDLDIETFPTLLVADGALLRFIGPLAPQPQTLARLLDGLPSDGPGLAAEPDVQALLDSLLSATSR